MNARRGTVLSLSAIFALIACILWFLQSGEGAAELYLCFEWRCDMRMVYRPEQASMACSRSLFLPNGYGQVKGVALADKDAAERFNWAVDKLHLWQVPLGRRVLRTMLLRDC